MAAVRFAALTMLLLCTDAQRQVQLFGGGQQQESALTAFVKEELRRNGKDAAVVDALVDEYRKFTEKPLIDRYTSCRVYVGVGAESCATKPSGDCNTYAFFQDSIFYVCHNGYGENCRARWKSWGGELDRCYEDNQYELQSLKSDHEEEEKKKRDAETLEQQRKRQEEVRVKRKQAAEEERQRQETRGCSPRGVCVQLPCQRCSSSGHLLSGASCT